MGRRIGRAVRALHRWLGLSCGAVLAAVALSGTVLVFQWPLLQWQYPALAAGTAPAPAQAAQALPGILREWTPQGARAIDFPRADLPVWQLYFDDGSRRYLDARTGALVLTRTAQNDALLWLRELHIDLLAGARGEQVLGACGLISLFLLVSGVWQWWPGRRRALASLRVHSRPRALLWLSSHRSAGVLALPVVLVLVVTGTAMIYGVETRAALRTLFGEGADVQAPAPRARLHGEIDWPAAVAAAQAAFPQARLSRLGVPAADSALAAIRARAPGEWHPVGRSVVWVDLASARALQVHDATTQGAGSRLNEAVYPVHGAFVGGLPWQAASALGGIVLAALFVTGALFWLGRRRPARSTGAEDARDAASPLN